MNVNTVLPASGVGFVTNNRGPSGKFQFGQKSTIDAAVAVGTAWDALNADRPFSIGQILSKVAAKCLLINRIGWVWMLMCDPCALMVRTNR